METRLLPLPLPELGDHILTREAAGNRSLTLFLSLFLVFFFKALVSINLFLLNPEALYVLLRRGRLSRARLFCNRGRPRRVGRFRLQSAKPPPVTADTGYETSAPQTLVLLHGGCCCLWYFVYDVNLYVSVPPRPHMPLSSCLLPSSLCPRPSVSQICIMLFDLPELIIHVLLTSPVSSVLSEICLFGSFYRLPFTPPPTASRPLCSVVTPASRDGFSC